MTAAQRCPNILYPGCPASSNLHMAEQEGSGSSGEQEDLLSAIYFKQLLLLFFFLLKIHLFKRENERAGRGEAEGKGDRES